MGVHAIVHRLQVRKGAAEAVLGLSASAEGRAALAGTDAATHLRRLVGDVSGAGAVAVAALVNLCEDGGMREQMLRAGMVSALMESLRDEECAHKGVIVMLLANLSLTPEGAAQILQHRSAGSSAAVAGLHFRRLIQWFVQPVSREDTFEHVASVLQNVTQLPDARSMLLDPERGILGPLTAQMRSASVVRRRGVAGTLRNLCFETDADTVRYLLSPAVDLPTVLLLPLAGPDVYTAEERADMHPSLYRGRSAGSRESDPHVRRMCVEALLLLATTRPGRDHLRRCRAYPVVRTFHEWLDARGVREVEDAAAPSEDASDRECAEAVVTAINSLVQQLFRDDEVSHTSQVTGKYAPGAADAHEPPRPPAGAVLALPAPSVPVEDARRVAAAVASGQAHDVSDVDLSSIVTPVPDWTSE